MKKTMVFDIVPDKETKGCHRYMWAAGDPGIRTIYLNKADIDGPPPKQLTVVATGE